MYEKNDIVSVRLSSNGELIVKLSELKNMNEHNTAPQGSAASIEQQLNWLDGATRLNGVTASIDGETFSIFKKVESIRTIVIILTRRTTQTIPVGYCTLDKNDKRWFVMDVWLKPELRKKGIITNLYASLSALGYKLQSGKILSKEAEGVWKKLGSEGVAKVLDTELGKIENFSLKPIGDGDLVTGKSPRFYWVTEGEIAMTCAHRTSDGLFTECFPHYLNGWTPNIISEESTLNTIMTGMCAFVIEADV